MKLASRGLSAVPAQPLRTDGILIRGSVLARVAGLRLLRLEATITLSPAEVATGGPPRIGFADGDPRRVRFAAVAGAPGTGFAQRSLGEAVRGMDEGTELLARARRNGI